MARKFFYVCAGMLMLALSFHLGFTTATAQAPTGPGSDVELAHGGQAGFALLSGRTLYALTYYGAGSTVELRQVDVPGSSPVVAVAAEADASVQGALLQNGDCYVTTAGSPLTLVGNVFSGGPTPTVRESWGQVKQRFAPNHGSARPSTDK